MPKTHKNKLAADAAEFVPDGVDDDDDDEVAGAAPLSLCDAATAIYARVRAQRASTNKINRFTSLLNSEQTSLRAMNLPSEVGIVFGQLYSNALCV